MNFLDYRSLLTEGSPKAGSNPLKLTSNFCRSYKELLSILIQGKLRAGINRFNTQSSFISCTINSNKLLKKLTTYKCGVALDRVKVETDFIGKPYNDTYRDLYTINEKKPVILKAFYKDGDNYNIILNLSTYSVPVPVTKHIYNNLIEELQGLQGMYKYTQNEPYEYARPQQKHIFIENDECYIINYGGVQIVGSYDGKNDKLKQKFENKLKYNKMHKIFCLKLDEESTNDFRNCVSEGEIRFSVQEIPNLYDYLIAIWVKDEQTYKDYKAKGLNLKVDTSLWDAINNNDIDYINDYTNEDELVKATIKYALLKHIKIMFNPNLVGIK